MDSASGLGRSISSIEDINNDGVTDLISGNLISNSAFIINLNETGCPGTCGNSIEEFDEICDGPRSQNDYIEIARWYPTVIVSGIPTLGSDLENQARRLIALVDEFYDRRVKLILSAAAPVDALYAGQRLDFEFERTVSRLIEMQSTDYLAAPHLA